MKKSYRSMIGKILPWLFLCVSYGLSLFYIKYNYYGLMNSDTSSELVLGKILSENGGIISDRWLYSTELRVINTQIVYKFVYGIAGNNWLIYRMISNAILLLILALSYLFMMHGLNLGKEGVLGAGFLILPFSPIYGYMVVYGAFYIPHIAFSFLSLGLTFRFLNRSDSKRKVLFGALLTVTGFLSGLGGVRQAMICYVPAVIAAVLRAYYRADNISLGKDNKEIGAVFANLILIISFGIGFLINKTVFTRYFRFDDQTEKLWGRFTIENINTVLDGFIKAIGTYDDVAFFGPLGIVNGIVLILVVLVIIAIRNVYRNDEHGYELRYYTTFVIAAFITNIVVLASGIEYYNLTYWIPVIPLFIPLLTILFQKKSETKSVSSLFATVIKYFCCAAVLFMAIATTKYPYESRYDIIYDRSDFKACGEFIRESGYEHGFAPFWLANHMVELTDGEIEMWVTESVDMTDVDSLSSQYRWLQDASHTEQLPEGAFFVMTYGHTEDTENNSDCLLYKNESNLIYSDEYFTVWGFDDMDEYRQVIASCR